MDWQGCHLRRLGRTSLNVSCVRWSFVVFHILVLINLTSLLGKNLAEDTADFGKSSLASRRHLGTCREDCFLISIRLLWPHAFCTQDLEHALSTAYLVTWCIDPVIFSMTHVRRHDIMEAVAVAAEAANRPSARGWHAEIYGSLFGCCGICTRQFFVCPCVNLRCCTYDFERTLSSAARAFVCRLTVSCGFTSARA